MKKHSKTPTLSQVNHPEMKFHIGDILSITTGRLVSPTAMRGVYKILNYMTGDNLFTHALVRAGEVCKPVLLEQFPDLKEITGEDVTKDNWREWLDHKVEQFGAKREVAPLAQWERRDPVAELVDMVGPDRVIVVKT